LDLENKKQKAPKNFKYPVKERIEVTPSPRKELKSNRIEIPSKRYPVLEASKGSIACMCEAICMSLLKIKRPRNRERNAGIK